MPVLVAALVLVTALALLNLVLTLGVIRRLREHTEMLNAGPAPDAPRPVMAPGGQVADFEVETVDGQPLSRQGLDDGTLVAFFSPDCWACKDQLPRFLEYAAGRGGAEEPVSVVVSGDGATELVEQLVPAARVVREAPDGPLVRAFGVRGFPAFCRLSPEGTVLTSSHDLAAVASATPGARTSR